LSNTVEKLKLEAKKKRFYDKGYVREVQGI
jgi:hypothetical protein